MGYQVHASRLAFQRTKEDDPQVPVGDVEIIERGGMVPDYVSPATINALFNAGVVVEVGDQPDPAIFPPYQIPAQPRSPEQPDVLPSDPQGTPVVLFPDTPAQPTTESAQPARPAATDSKEAWENYAASPKVGMDRAEAEGLTKAKLIAEVTKREAGTTATGTGN